MTGFLDDGANPLSSMTIKSLEDLGFTVDLNKAEQYTIPGSGGAKLTTPGVRGPPKIDMSGDGITPKDAATKFFSGIGR
jgi:hypothetical protein